MCTNLSSFTDVLGDEIPDSQPISFGSSVETQSRFDIEENARYTRPVKGTGQVGNFRSIEEIDPKYRHVFTYQYFNLVQSGVIDDALYTDKSMVVCAPTGSGKTVVFEMAIVQLLMDIENKNDRDNFKIIYMAPVKALCTERLTEWYSKFNKIGLLCIEVTGDTDIEFGQLQPYKIIITTPEKWDILTRRWRDHRGLVEMVKLFLIDEVHILNDNIRGPVLEAVVSRMKTIESAAQSAHRIEKLQEQYQMNTDSMTVSTVKTSPPRIRFVAVSATVSNPEDVSAWLGSEDKPAVFYKFGDECRPVKIHRVVEGYPCPDGTSIFKFDIILNYKLWPIIQKYHNGKPTLGYNYTLPYLTLLYLTLPYVTLCLSLGHKSLDIASVYIEPRSDDNGTVNRLSAFLNSTGASLRLIGGDVNGSHQEWGEDAMDSRGGDLAALMASHNLAVCNTGQEPTFERVCNNTLYSSIVDVTYVTQNLADSVINWQVNREACPTSDHNAIDYTLKTPHRPERVKSNSTYKYSTFRANWQAFKEEVGNKMSELARTDFNIASNSDLDRIVNKFTAIIQEVCDNTLLHKSGPRVFNPWWSDELEQQKKNCIRLHHRLHDLKKTKKPLTEAVKTYQDAKQAYAKTLSKTSTEHFRQFCTAQDAPQRKPPQTLKCGSTYTDSGTNTASALLQHLYPDDSPDNLDHHRRLRNSQSEAPDTADDLPFTTDEVRECLSQINAKKAPGADHFTADICREVFETLPDFITALYNRCLTTGCFPKKWKQAVVKIIPKPNKTNPDSLNSFRPIGLIPVFGKTLEKLMIKRITYLCEREESLNKNQYGFREQVSTVDALENALNTIKTAKSGKKEVAAISLDIKAAFDNAWWPALFERLKHISCPKNIYKLVQGYFTDRQVSLSYANCTASKTMTKGCVQGSACGPTFWNLILDELLSTPLPPGAHIQAFADDVLLIVEGGTGAEVETIASECLNSIGRWGENVKLQFGPQKTQAIAFTAKARQSKIVMGNSDIPLASQIKLLGVIIDDRLNFIQHANYVIKKATKIFKYLCKFVRPTWGIHSENVECIYRQVIVPMITYAAGIWGTATKFHSVRRALRSFQRGFSIRAIRGFHTISAVAAEALAQFPPLYLVVEEAHAIHTAKKTGLSPDLPDDIRMHRRVKVKHLLHPAQRITINFEEVSTQEETEQLLNPDAPSIFTDGSKQDTGETGASYIIMLPNHTHIVRKLKLCRTASVFFTELFAIDHALKWALKGNHAEVSVFTDSLSALKAIQDRSNTDPLVNSIHHSLYSLQDKQTNIRFIWTKAHVGIVGNELADAAAKEAATKKTAALMNVFPLSHTKRYLKERTLNAWQEDYATAPQGAVTKSFFQTVAEIPEFRTRQMLGTSPVVGFDRKAEPPNDFHRVSARCLVLPFLGGDLPASVLRDCCAGWLIAEGSGILSTVVGGPSSRKATYERLPRQLAKNPRMRHRAGWRPDERARWTLPGGLGPPHKMHSVCDQIVHSTSVFPPNKYSRYEKRNRKKVQQRQHALSLKVHLTNIRGLHSNLVPVHHHLETQKPALFFLTETQIRCPSDQAYLMYPGYNIEHNFKPRSGVCLYARDDICYRRLRNLEDPRFSALWILLDTGMEKILYACVYRSHTGDLETTRLTEYLGEAADLAQQRYPTAQLVFLGDFNAHHQEWLFPYRVTDHAGRETRKLALALNLTQLVREATRVPDTDSQTPNCLDLLLTTDPDRYSVSVSSPLGKSDHCLVKSVSVYSPPDPSPRGTRRMWRYKSADWDGMRSFFASYPWQPVCFTSGDPSICADAVTDVLTLGMEYFIPYSDLPLSGKARPWFGPQCARAEAQKHEAYLAWADARHRKANDLRQKKQAYNRSAKACKKVLQKARFDHISRIGNKLASYPTGNKAFWSLAKSVEANFCRPSLPPLQKPDGTLAHTAEEKANLFVSQFAEASSLDAGSAVPPTSFGCSTAMSNIRIRQVEVRKVLRNLDENKASGPDGIPAIVLKTCAPELSPVLTRLFRLSLDTEQVPKSWKLANVQPVPKKGSHADPANYRPISVTSLLCKSMERVLNHKILAYLEANDLLSDRQFGFRRNRSTGDLLVYATHIWSEAIEKHGEALAVSLDISKAFDMVWHDGLISKLPSYGLPTALCAWISDSYWETARRTVYG
ncbi:hypothetical protein evm_003649 [Chilo suppressalis]|nr:hypothetical protein evm_003649 [Chilo suppressalis]